MKPRIKTIYGFICVQGGLALTYKASHDAEGRMTVYQRYDLFGLDLSGIISDSELLAGDAVRLVEMRIGSKSFTQNTYDKYDRLIERFDGQHRFTYEYHFCENKRVVRGMEIPSGELTFYEYDDMGNKIREWSEREHEESEPWGNGWSTKIIKTLFESRFKYTPDSRLVEVKRFHNKILVSKISYNAHDNGFLKETHRHSDDLMHGSVTYEKYDNLKNKIESWVDNMSSVSEITKYIHEFDEAGNWITEIPTIDDGRSSRRHRLIVYYE